MTVCIGLVLVASPTGARAAGPSDDDTTDGRLEGYGAKTEGPTRPGQDVTQVALAKSGVGGTWILFVLMSVLGCSVLFKNAKRSHLD